MFGHYNVFHHTVVELEIDGKYRIFDPYFNAIFENNERNLATFSDLQNYNIINIVQDQEVPQDTRFFEDPSEYYMHFEPLNLPKTLYQREGQRIDRRPIATLIDFYYEVFGDVFLIPFEKLYHKMDKSSPLMTAQD